MVKGIILAAGRGSRLGGRTDDRPKCMVELWGKPLLHWQISALRGAGIDDITIVRGYMADKINVSGVSFLENKRWAETNMVATLMEARQILVNNPTVVSYSDIVYSPDAVRALLGGRGDIRITYDPDWRQLWEMRFDDPLCDAETFKVETTTERLLEIGNRPQSYDEVQGQYMGLLYFEPEGWRVVESAIGTLDQNTLARIDCTAMLKRLIHDHDVHAIPINDKWCEVDSNDDLLAYSKFEPILRSAMGQ
jgi:L-glutamine-phosphate cytidylyltransferase